MLQQCHARVCPQRSGSRDQSGCRCTCIRSITVRDGDSVEGPQCPRTDGRRDAPWAGHTTEWYSALKKERDPATTQMNLEHTLGSVN